MAIDTTAAYLGGPAVQGERSGSKVGRHPALFCIHQMNWVNSHNGSAMMTAA